MRRAGAVGFFYASELLWSFASTVSFTVTGVYFVSTLGLSPFELVLVGTVMELSIFVFEVPTGVVADTYSRRLSVVIGWAVMGAGMVLVGSVHAYLAVLAGYAVWGLGYTFTSGAYTAWITDEVGIDRVGRILARGQQLSYLGAIVGLPVSVGLAVIDLGLAVAVGGGLLAVLAVAAALRMPEHGFRRRPRAERETAWRELRTTAGAAGRYVRAERVLLLIMAIAFFAGASTESFDRLREAQFLRNVGLPSLGGLDPVVWFGVFGLGTLVIGVVAAEVLVRRFDRVGREGLARLLLGVTALQAATVVVFALAGNLAVALAGYWLYYLTRSLASPAFNVWLNENVTDSGVRATVLSFTSQADAIGQVGGGPALGAVGNVFGLRAALLAGGTLLLPALGLYGRAVRHGGGEPELERLSTPARGSSAARTPA
jgi:DHA3 family tetracycline resistance protein-like MFS transporter